MAITKIIVTDIIMTGSLFDEPGFNESQSADNLAELKGQIIVDYLAEKYPGIEICADIAIQQEKGGPRPLEVQAFTEKGEPDHTESATLREQLVRKIAEGTADTTWAVRA